MASHILVVDSGATLATWTDEPLLSTEHSRINPNPLYPLKYYRIEVTPTTSATLNISARPGYGQTWQADAAITPDLFIWSWGERGDGAPPAITTVASFTSRARVTFRPYNTGHWLLTCWRNGAGAVCIPLSVIDPTALL